MSYQKEANNVKGRGFGTVDGVPSFMNRFKTWIAKSAALGGPAWFIIDDQSANVNNPYIIISDKGSLTNANRNKIIQVWIPTSPNVADRVYFTFFTCWNTSTHTGSGVLCEHSVSTQESTEFAYDFRGGPETLLIMTRIGTSWTWTLITDWVGTSTLVEDEAGHTGTLIQNWIVETGDTSNQLSQYHRLTGTGPYLDATGKLYFSTVISAGTLALNIYKSSARLAGDLIGSLSASGSTGLRTITAQNGSSLGGQINIDSVAGSSNSNIAVDFSLYFGSGEGAGFTPGKWYFIWDFYSDNVAKVNYVKVLSVIGDQVICSGLNTVNGFANSGNPFAAGAVMSPYGHRFFIWGSLAGGGNGNLSQLPYHSLIEYGGGVRCDGYSANSISSFALAAQVFQLMNPDDEGRYAVMKLLVHEYQSRFNGITYAGAVGTEKPNRAYGQLKNMYVTATTGLSQMLDGRIVGGNQYLNFYQNISIAYLILDSTSL